MKTFEQWIVEVDHAIGARLGGMTSNDLPDRPYMDMYNDGMTPQEAALEAIEYANE